MQSLRGSIGIIGSHVTKSISIIRSKSECSTLGKGKSDDFPWISCRQVQIHRHVDDIENMSQPKVGSQIESLTQSHNNGIPSALHLYRSLQQGLFRWERVGGTSPTRFITTMGDAAEFVSEDGSSSISDIAPRIKFKRLDKTAKHIMQILDKEDVEKVRSHREIPDIQPGYIVQLKVEVPENKRRVSTLKGIVIARRNAGLNTTFRLRRLVAGVGVESVFPLYSPNIKEMKILDKKKVRRAKLYYLRDKMNPLKR